MSSHTNDLPFEYEGFSNPNGTIVPDDVFDVLMPRLTDAELRILLYIIRRTFGFKKNSDDISLRQMVEGIRTRDGRVLDSGTGLSKPTVARGLIGLRGKKIIVATRNRSAERGNEATTYRLRFKGGDEAAAEVETDPRENGGRVPLSHQRDKGVSHERDKGLSHQRDTQQTVLQQTEISFSKSSKSTHSNDDFVDNSTSHPISADHRNVEPRPALTTQHHSATSIGLEDIGAVLKRRQENIAAHAPNRGGESKRRSNRRTLPAIPPEEYEAVIRLMRDYSRTLGDMEHVESNITHVVNLMQKAGVDFNTVYMYAIEAERETKKRTRLRNRMGYFFSVLEDRLGLKAHDAGASPPN